jgi:hypothetical protein
VQGRPARVWIRSADGAPEALALTVGIADDSFTEVLSGDLREGQEVITGILNQSTRLWYTYAATFACSSAAIFSSAAVTVGS